MKPNPTPGPAADPVLLLIAAGWLAAEALAVLLIAAAALLLTLAGWSFAAPIRPSAAAPAPAAASEAPPCPAAPRPASLEGLTVAQLRRLARAAGLPQLGRSGRRSELLLALAAAPG